MVILGCEGCFRFPDDISNSKKRQQIAQIVPPLAAARIALAMHNKSLELSSDEAGILTGSNYDIVDTTWHGPGTVYLPPPHVRRDRPRISRKIT